MNKVSIIIPNYNGAKYIGDTIESILNQSYNNWEAIVIDDGSSDESERIVKSYQSSNIRFINRPDCTKKGANSCRNIGIENASGDFIIFLDSDDILAPQCLKNRVSVMEENPHLDFAVFNNYHFSGKIENRIQHSNLKVANPLACFLGLNCVWQTSCPIWRTDFIKGVLFNEDFLRLQDPEMTIRALQKKDVKYSLRVDSVPDSYYRIVKKNKKSQKITTNYNHPFNQFIDAFYPIKMQGDCWTKARKSIFLQMSLHHILAGDISNISKYRENTKKIRLDSRLADEIIYLLCEHPFLFRLVSFCALKKFIVKFINMRLNKNWGSEIITY